MKKLNQFDTLVIDEFEEEKFHPRCTPWNHLHNKGLKAEE